MLTGILVLMATAGALQQGSPEAHYRITLKASRNVERTTSGEEARGGTYSAVAYVTATTTGEAGGRSGHVVIDSVKNRSLISEGSFYWGGAASTIFWVDPADDLSVSFYTQLIPTGTYPLRRKLQQLVYQALVD